MSQWCNYQHPVDELKPDHANVTYPAREGMRQTECIHVTPIVLYYWKQTINKKQASQTRYAWRRHVTTMRKYEMQQDSRSCPTLPTLYKGMLDK